MKTMDRRFLHTLQAGENHREYLVTGIPWRGTGFGVGGDGWDELSRSIDDSASEKGHVSVQVGYDGGFAWKYYLRVTEQFLFSHSGKAETVEAACAEALACVPEVFTLDYLGRQFALYGSIRKNGSSSWGMDIDGDVATVSGPYKRHEGTEYWRWERPWGPANAVLVFAELNNLSGSRPTLRDAVIAAIDAPELFKRACGEVIATIRREA